MGISVIFTAYNEEASIESTIQRSLDALRAQFEAFEIILIDDCSKDRTGNLADTLAARNPEIRVIHNVRNLGQGRSLVIGFEWARQDLVIHNAMDYPFDLRDLAKLIPLLGDADVVVAARTQRPGYSLYRKLLSVTNVRLLNFLFGLGLRDYNFVQLYKREVLKAVSPETHSTGFLTPGILIRAHDLGFRIREVPIEYHPRTKGVATAGSFRVVWASFRDVMKFWLHRKPYSAKRP